LVLITTITKIRDMMTQNLILIHGQVPKISNKIKILSLFFKPIVHLRTRRERGTTKKEKPTF
jgi:hypothetical protein